MAVFSSFFFLLAFISFFKSYTAIDTLTSNQTLIDKGQTLVSSRGSFELGFFSPWNSKNRYVGIWFRNVHEQTAVWVANRDNPISDSSGLLRISPTGTIHLFNNQSDIPIWSSNSPTKPPQNAILQLLDSGNLVVKDGIAGTNYLWQSFDHPCHTLIPGMKLGRNFKTNQNWSLTSWKNAQDPSVGDYTYELDPHGLPQLVQLRNGSRIVYRSGPWDSLTFGGGPPLRQNAVFTPQFVFKLPLVYYSFVNNENTTISRFVVKEQGLLKYSIWNQRRGEWVDIISLQTDKCDAYNKCGPNGLCNSNKPCRCPKGFEPKIPQDWSDLDTSGGCVRKKQLNCSSNVGFIKFSRLKLPDSYQFLVNKSVSSLLECEKACLRNCSCKAYASTGFSGCVIWFGDLQDIKEYSEGGQDLYIKVDASDIESNGRRRAIIILVPTISGVLIFIAVICFLTKKRSPKKIEAAGNESIQYPRAEKPSCGDEDLDQLPLYDIVVILSATSNFSYENKIGEGGFGAVYRGDLPSGQQIAVKRLSKDSRQGLQEFKNEVLFISKLQHRNLVRLLGCCIHEEERMLVYEYMPNRSLDVCLFNQTRGTSLDWPTRFNIIVGVARGLLYLHRDSRLRIVHRDLKASNILLDDEMNPKISDFGLAKTFGGDQNAENTNRVIGTYGYMSPEYAIEGLFSVKSDIFSFGVLVLEIVSGKKNRGFCHPEHDLNLLGHAWRLWVEERPMELVDNVMEQPMVESELMKCIQVGLLCVQQRPQDRPTMSSVVSMLDSEHVMLLQPKQPGFYTDRFLTETDSSSTAFQSHYEVTVTKLHGR